MILTSAINNSAAAELLMAEESYFYSTVEITQ